MCVRYLWFVGLSLAFLIVNLWTSVWKKIRSAYQLLQRAAKCSDFFLFSKHTYTIYYFRKPKASQTPFSLLFRLWSVVRCQYYSRPPKKIISRHTLESNKFAPKKNPSCFFRKVLQKFFKLFLIYKSTSKIVRNQTKWFFNPKNKWEEKQ